MPSNTSRTSVVNKHKRAVKRFQISIFLKFSICLSLSRCLSGCLFLSISGSERFFLIVLYISDRFVIHFTPSLSPILFYFYELQRFFEGQCTFITEVRFQAANASLHRISFVDKDEMPFYKTDRAQACRRSSRVMLVQYTDSKRRIISLFNTRGPTINTQCPCLMHYGY